MNRNASIALSGTAIALAIGLLGLNGVFSMSPETPATTYSADLYCNNGIWSNNVKTM
jgi:hypothetical protein